MALDEVYFYEEEQHYKGLYRQRDKLWDRPCVEKHGIKVSNVNRYNPKLNTKFQAQLVSADVETIFVKEDALSIISWVDGLITYKDMSDNYTATYFDNELAQVIWSIVKDDVISDNDILSAVGAYMQALDTSEDFNPCPQIFEAADKANSIDDVLESLENSIYGPNEFVYNEMYNRKLLSLASYNEDHYLQYVVNNLDDKNIYTEYNYRSNIVADNREVIAKLVEYNRELAEKVLKDSYLPFEVYNIYREMLGMEQVSMLEYSAQQDEIVPF